MSLTTPLCRFPTENERMIPYSLQCSCDFLTTSKDQVKLIISQHFQVATLVPPSMELARRHKLALDCCHVFSGNLLNVWRAIIKISPWGTFYVRNKFPGWIAFSLNTLQSIIQVKSIQVKNPQEVDHVHSLIKSTNPKKHESIKKVERSQRNAFSNLLCACCVCKATALA